MKRKKNTAIRNYLCNQCHVKVSALAHPMECPYCGYTMSLVKNHPLERDTTPTVAETVNMYTEHRQRESEEEVAKREALIEVSFASCMADLHNLLWIEAEMDKYA